MDKLRIKSGTEVELRRNNVLLCSANGTTGLHMWRMLWINIYDIVGGKEMATTNNTYARKII